MVGRTGAGKSSLLQARDVVFFFFCAGILGFAGLGLSGLQGLAFGVGV